MFGDKGELFYFVERSILVFGARNASSKQPVDGEAAGKQSWFPKASNRE